MYRLDYSCVKKGYNMVAVMVLLGVLFLVGDVFLLKSTIDNKKRMNAYTYTTNITYHSYRSSDKTMYTPIYQYNVNGIEYQCRANGSSNIKPSNKTTKIFYNSNNPYDCLAPDDEKFAYIFSAILLATSFIFLVAGVKDYKKITNKIADMRYLELHGKLIKNLPYEMVPTGTRINNRTIYAIEAIYKTKNGSTLRFLGEPRYDHKIADDDGFVDLLIDPNNSDCYYVDFNIS